jgi:hypothetical protein
LRQSIVAFKLLIHLRSVVAFRGDNPDMGFTGTAKKSSSSIEELAASGRPPTILVADDLRLDRTHLEYVLVREKHSFLSANSGREAMKLFDEHQPPIVRAGRWRTSRESNCASIYGKKFKSPTHTSSFLPNDRKRRTRHRAGGLGPMTALNPFIPANC